MDIDELAGEQPHHVDHVYALVEQDPPAGDLALGAPVLVEADHLRLAVHAAQIDDVAQLAALDDLQRVAHRLVVAMVESVLELQVGVAPARPRGL